VVKASGGRILGLLQCRILTVTASGRGINNFQKNEDTWCRILGYLRYRIKYSSKSIQRAVALMIFCIFMSGGILMATATCRICTAMLMSGI
jgi:hypothetical protein